PRAARRAEGLAAPGPVGPGHPRRTALPGHAADPVQPGRHRHPQHRDRRPHLRPDRLTPRALTADHHTHQKATDTMRKLIESTFMTLDGVIEAPEQWGPPYWDDEHSGYAERLMATTDALLLGRETYEGFAGVWPQMEKDGVDGAAEMNALPKYVAS